MLETCLWFLATLHAELSGIAQPPQLVQISIKFQSVANKHEWIQSDLALDVWEQEGRLYFGHLRLFCNARDTGATRNTYATRKLFYARHAVFSCEDHKLFLDTQRAPWIVRDFAKPPCDLAICCSFCHICLQC